MNKGDRMKNWTKTKTLPKHSELFQNDPKRSQNAPELSEPFPDAFKIIRMVLKENFENRIEPTWSDRIL